MSSRILLLSNLANCTIVAHQNEISSPCKRLPQKEDQPLCDEMQTKHGMRRQQYGWSRRSLKVPLEEEGVSIFAFNTLMRQSQHWQRHPSNNMSRSPPRYHITNTDANRVEVNDVTVQIIDYSTSEKIVARSSRRMEKTTQCPWPSF